MAELYTHVKLLLTFLSSDFKSEKVRKSQKSQKSQNNSENSEKNSENSEKNSEMTSHDLIHIS
jgi:hypothetical protein